MNYQKEPTALVVVACNAQARFLYFLNEEKRLVERSCLVNAMARERSPDLITGKLDNVRDADGVSQYDVSQTKIENDRSATFAAQVAAKISRDVASREIRNLVIVASPPFSSRLRETLPKHCDSISTVQISQDLTHLSEDDILVEIAEDLSALQGPI